MESLNFDTVESEVREFAINGDENRVIRFCPSDFRLANKIFELLNSDFSNFDKLGKEALDAEEKLATRINEIFGMDVCTPVFQGESLLAFVGKGNGHQPKLAVQAFLESIFSLLINTQKSFQEEMLAEQKKLEAETAKYTEGYPTELKVEAPLEKVNEQ
jgi:hypothetical protein